MLPPENIPFSLGVNYPWRNYGHDFGCTNGEHLGISLSKAQESIARDFAQIREAGVSVVRWFLFGDGRGGFLTEDGIPRKPDDFLFADVAAALHLAESHNLKLCLPLIDYLWLQEHGGKRHAYAHEHVLHFAAGREAFLQNVLIPLFEKFQGHPAIFAWDIANEPEWAIHEFHPIAEAKFRFADFRAYAVEIARAVHEYGKTPVTLGSGRLMWVRAWTTVGLDYYQAHYYPSSEAENRGNLAQQLATLQPLDKPLWLGELPARDPSRPDYSLREALDACRSSGLCGAAVWRWTQSEAEGTDGAAGCVEPAELVAWSKSEKAAHRSA